MARDNRRLGPWDSLGNLITSIENLENTYVKCIWFESIASGTSGSFAPPAGGTINLNEWSDGVDVLVSGEVAGVPNFASILDTEDAQITGTLDVDGNWTISGIPADGYPISLIYSYSVKLSGFDHSKCLESAQIAGPPLLEFLGKLNKLFTGFPNYGQNTTSISWDDATRTFTIQPTGDKFTVWVEGVEFVFTTPQTVQATDTEGVWLFYFDNTGTLAATQTYSAALLTDNALAGLIYWDATNNTAIIFGDERHGMEMPGETHSWIHFTQGAQIISGFSVSSINATGNGSLNSHAQIGLSHGIFVDDDIEHETSDSGQVVALPAQLPVFYMDGPTGTWRKVAADDFPVRTYAGGSNLLAWNEFDGADWVQTEVGNAKFVLAHIFATHDIDEPLMALQGQNQYDSLSDAREGALTELRSNFTTYGLPTPEIVPLYTIIYQTSIAYANDVQARIVQTDNGDDYIDWRFSGIAGAGGGGAGGAGNVVGPASSTDNAVARFDGTTGTLLQNSSATLDDAGVMTLVGLTVTNGAELTATTQILKQAGSEVFRTVTGGFQLTDGSSIGQLSFSAGVLYIDNQAHSGNIQIRGEDAGGTARVGLEIDPDGSTYLGYNGTNIAYTRMDTNWGGLKITKGGSAGIDIVTWTNTGDAYFTSNHAGGDVFIQARNAANSATYTVFYGNSDTYSAMYYQGVNYMQTANTGTEGGIKVGSFGLGIYIITNGDGSVGYIDGKGSQLNLRIAATNCIDFTGSGATAKVGLYYGGSKSAETTSEGISVVGGVKFPATQAPSSDANTLDDYEEGTWTPVIADASSGGNTGTYTDGDQATYTKIGRQVTVRAKLVEINTSGMTAGNDLYIRGLPFVSAGSNVGSVMMYNVAFTGHVSMYVATGDDYMRIPETINGSAWDWITVADLTSGSAYIYFTLTYFV